MQRHLSELSALLLFLAGGMNYVLVVYDDHYASLTHLLTFEAHKFVLSFYAPSLNQNF